MGIYTGAVHSNRKVEAGRRAGLKLVKLVYGADILDSGPLFERLVLEERDIVLHFNHTEHFHTHGTGDCNMTEFDSSRLCCGESPFLIHSVDGKRYRTERFEIKGNTFEISIPKEVKTEDVTEVSYTYEIYHQCAL